MIGVMDGLGFALDVVFAWVYLNTAGHDAALSRARRLLTPLLLLLSYVLYGYTFKAWFTFTPLRFAVRAELYFLCLLVNRGVTPVIALYDGLYTAACVTLIHNAFLSPLTLSLLTAGTAFTASRGFNVLLCALIVYGIKSLCYWLLIRLVPLDTVGRAGAPRFVLLLAVTALSLYLKQVQIPISYGGEHPQALYSLYYIALQAALLLFLLVFERYQRSLAQEEASRLQAVSAQALLKTVKTQQEKDDAIRALRHDLKNHVLTLRHMMENGETEKASHYMERFLEQTRPGPMQLHTGNALLDVLMGDKLSTAAQEGIQTNVVLDFSRGDFMEDFDLCVLIGNALDNALESCRAAEKQENRFIDVRGGCQANFLQLSITNGREKELRLAGALPLTTKRDRENHGFGLRNMQKTLEKYGGTLSTDISDPNRFTLNMLIPLPEDNS